MELSQLKDIAYKKKKGLPRYATAITHNISIRVVSVLKNYNINPDWITGFSILLGVIVSLLFCFPQRYTILLGAILLELYYVFDAIDGQLARAINRASLTGAYLDYISNHIVHSLVFLGIGFGLYQRFDNIVYAAAGFFAAWGMLFMYIIFDAKANVMLDKKAPIGSQKNVQPQTDVGRISFFKKAFIFLHQLCRYPTIMNIITISALLNLFITFYSRDYDAVIFCWVIIFYALALNIVWISKLTKVVLSKDLG